MADLALRFGKDMLVVSSPIQEALRRAGIESVCDQALALLVEPETIEEGCQEGRGRRGRRVASNKMRFRKGGLIPPFLLGVSQKRATGYSSVAQTVLARQNRTFSPVLFAAELAW